MKTIPAFHNICVYTSIPRRDVLPIGDTFRRLTFENIVHIVNKVDSGEQRQSVPQAFLSASEWWSRSEFASHRSHWMTLPPKYAIEVALDFFGTEDTNFVLDNYLTLLENPSHLFHESVIRCVRAHEHKLLVSVFEALSALDVVDAPP